MDDETPEFWKRQLEGARQQEALAWARAGDLEAENERLRAFARDARALAYGGDCDYCGATDRLLGLAEQHGLDGP